LAQHSRIPVLVLFLAVSSAFAQTKPQRPRVLGIAHVALNVSDLSKARMFYEDFLGFDEPFALRRPDGTDWIVYLKVNDEQYLELVSDNRRWDGQLNHFAIYTDNLPAMGEYLVSRGVPLVNGIHNGQVGNPFLTIRDPDHHQIPLCDQYGREKAGRVPCQRV
jgi:catechol 2,3-dioxygenase-like lactoylglutathione lyase family enzyme